ncbi:MAG: hypothetical protein OEQ39_11040 [Gammaproteobacteria bacterium]|nr:hypothetical protein [Gammaproteobacteria bacterium]MDH3466947.1 hypothetical protein [Gammaproteobacteria bacterium]
METLLTRPEIQSAAAPLLVALAVGLILRAFGRPWPLLGAVVGFLATAWLINGLQFTPLTGARKIIVIAAAAGVVGVLADVMPRLRARPVWLALFSAGAALWLIWKVLARREGVDLMVVGAPAVAYVMWLTLCLDFGRRAEIPTLAAGLALALGTGAVSILSASALLGQLAFGLGAAIGGVFLLVVFWKDSVAGAVFTVPVGILAGLIGYAGYVFAKVPWYALAVLAIVPLAAHIPLPKAWPRIVRAAVHTLLGVIVSAVAVGVVWWLMEDSGGY